MSQNIYLGHDETLLWSSGGNIYRSLERAKRYRSTIYWKYVDGKSIRLEEPILAPIYEVKLEWNLVDV